MKRKVIEETVDDLGLIIKHSLESRAFVTEEAVRLRMKLLGVLGESETSWEKKGHKYIDE